MFSMFVPYGRCGRGKDGLFNFFSVDGLDVIENIRIVWQYGDTKTEGKAGGKIDSDGTDRPETSGRFTEAKRFSPA